VTVFLTTPYVLSIAGEIPLDPQCDDLSKMDAILALPCAHYLGRDVCGTDWLKAAAMLETAARLRPLEVHNDVFAWSIARVFPELNGHVLQGAPADALALVAASREDRITVSRRRCAAPQVGDRVGPSGPIFPPVDTSPAGSGTRRIRQSRPQRRPPAPRALAVYGRARDGTLLNRRRGSSLPEGKIFPPGDMNRADSGTGRVRQPRP
jgi:death-on-curing protein